MKHIKKYENSYSERNLFDIAKDVFSFLIDENKIIGCLSVHLKIEAYRF